MAESSIQVKVADLPEVLAAFAEVRVVIVRLREALEHVVADTREWDGVLIITPEAFAHAQHVLDTEAAA